MLTAKRVHGPRAPSACTSRLATIALASPRRLQAFVSQHRKNLEADSQFSMHCTSENDKPQESTIFSNLSFPKLNATLNVDNDVIRPANIFKNFYLWRKWHDRQAQGRCHLLLFLSIKLSFICLNLPHPPCASKLRGGNRYLCTAHTSSHSRGGWGRWERDSTKRRMKRKKR